MSEHAPTPSPEALSGQIICPACGQANEPSRVFCQRCATELAPVAAATAPVFAEPPRARSVPPVAILGGLAAVVVVGLLAVFVLLPKDTPGPSSGTTTVPSAPSGSSAVVPSAGQSDAPSAGTTESPPVETATPPSIASLGGRVAFGAIKGNNADIWVWDPADDSVTELIAGAGSQNEPAWSPDGTLLAFRTPDGIHMATSNGDPADPPDFTHHGQDRGPTWSRDGKRVVFASDRPPFQSVDIGYRVADDNQADVVQLTANKADDWDPAFTPDGDTIVFVSARLGDSHLFRMDADGRGETEIDLGAGVFDDPAVSPDGDWIAFTRRDDKDSQKELWKAQLDGSGMTQLSETAANENDMAWSPDGSVIAVARADDDNRIVLVDADTGDELGSFGVDGARSVQPDWWWPQD